MSQVNRGDEMAGEAAHEPQRVACACHAQREQWVRVLTHGDLIVYECPACGRRHYELVVDPGELQDLFGGGERD